MYKKRIKPIEETQSVLNTDRFDRRRFCEILSKSQNMQKTLKEGIEILPSFYPLMSDVWASFYKTQPKIKEEVEPTVIQNKEFIEKVHESEDFQKLHPTTRLDDLTSAISTLSYSEKVIDWIIDQRINNDLLNQMMIEALNQQKRLNRMLRKIEEAENKNLSEQEKTNLENSKDEIQKTFEQTMSQLQKELSKSMKSKEMNDLLLETLKETKETKRSLDQLLQYGAGTQASDLKTMPLNDKLILADTLRKNKKVRVIAEWAGRFKEIAKQKRKSKSLHSIEQSGVTIGNEVERLLPQELAFYKHPSTKLDFLRRFSERQTMMFSPESKEEVGKGPFVICLDQSGSMTHLDEQSKGFVLAMAMIARKERRDFAVIPFSSDQRLESYFFKKGKITASELTTMAESFLDGGTLFIPPLKEAMEIIQHNKHLKRADILFVTDGTPSDHTKLKTFIKTNFKVFKKKHEVNVMSVLIGDKCPEIVVKTFSDRIIKANDFMNDEVTDLFKM